jgi:hypothetical protein
MDPARSVPPLQGGCHEVELFMGNKTFPGRCPGLDHRRAVGT